MKPLFFILILVPLLLAGCATQQPIQPYNCPVCTCPTSTTTTTSNSQTLSIFFINVGQGDSTLIKSQNTTMLIDCGKNIAGPTVVSFLKAHQVSTIDYLLMTHPDADHIGGCQDVLEQLTVSNIIKNADTSDTATYARVEQLIQGKNTQIAHEGDSWRIGPAQVKVLQALTTNGDNNEDSIVTVLRYDSFSALFTADCDRKCEEALTNKGIDADVLKVPHHGTKYATSIRFLGAVTPSAAIISVGDNSYGHPAQETLDRLFQENVTVYRTDMIGNIGVESNGNGYTIT